MATTSQSITAVDESVQVFKTLDKVVNTSAKNIVDKNKKVSQSYDETVKKVIPTMKELQKVLEDSGSKSDIGFKKAEVAAKSLDKATKSVHRGAETVVKSFSGLSKATSTVKDLEKELKNVEKTTKKLQVEGERNLKLETKQRDKAKAYFTQLHVSTNKQVKMERDMHLLEAKGLNNKINKQKKLKSIVEEIRKLNKAANLRDENFAKNREKLDKKREERNKVFRSIAIQDKKFEVDKINLNNQLLLGKDKIESIQQKINKSENKLLQIEKDSKVVSDKIVKSVAKREQAYKDLEKAKLKSEKAGTTGSKLSPQGTHDVRSIVARFGQLRTGAMSAGSSISLLVNQTLSLKNLSSELNNTGSTYSKTQENIRTYREETNKSTESVVESTTKTGMLGSMFSAASDKMSPLLTNTSRLGKSTNLLVTVFKNLSFGLLSILASLPLLIPMLLTVMNAMVSVSQAGIDLEYTMSKISMVIGFDKGSKELTNI